MVQWNGTNIHTIPTQLDVPASLCIEHRDKTTKHESDTSQIKPNRNEDHSCLPSPGGGTYEEEKKVAETSELNVVEQMGDEKRRNYEELTASEVQEHSNNWAVAAVLEVEGSIGWS